MVRKKLSYKKKSQIKSKKNNRSKRKLNKKQKGGNPITSFEDIMLDYNQDLGSLLFNFERKMKLCLDNKSCDEKDWVDFQKIANNVVNKCNTIIFKIDSQAGGSRRSRYSEDFNNPEDLEIFTDSDYPYEEDQYSQPEFEQTTSYFVRGNNPLEPMQKSTIRTACNLLRNSVCELFTKCNRPLNNCMY